jgi:dipeptidyl aminopeptidase/acylaminoacyl peptidase
MRRLIAITVLIHCIAAHAQRREVGSLVLDKVPDPPARIAERAAQYQAARGAGFLDWEPSGNGMLIATRFGDTTQIHQVAAPGGDRRQLTFFKEPVSEAVYSAGGAGKKNAGLLLRMDSGGGEFYQYHYFDLTTGRPQLLTDGKSRNEGLMPSHNRARFAFASTLRNGKDFDLYVMNGTDGRGIKRVHQGEGQWNVVDWSPDDTKLLARRYVSINESYLYVVDLVTGDATELNPQKDKKIAYGPAAFARKGGGIYLVSDEDSEFRRIVKLDAASGKKEIVSPKVDWDVDDLELSPDGTLAYTLNEGGTSALFVMAPGGKPVRIPTEPGVMGRLRFDESGKRLGFSLSSSRSSADAYGLEVKTRKLTRWTQSEVGGINPAVFVAPERIQVESFDKRPISAWYYKPHGADATHKAPVIITIHGGPEAQASAAFSPVIQYWVLELGAAVIAPNVRGSSGYGKSFLLLDNADKREDSVKDIGALLDWVGERPELDAARVAVQGGSYGGYMVLASMAMFPDRVRCGVEIVGISNFVTFLEHTEGYRRDLRRAEYGDERDPEMRKKLNAISPTTLVAKIKKPLFVAQGKNDPRVPYTEAEQIVKAVRDAGGTAWYLLAKDEGHGFQKKPNRDFYQNASALFFEEYLLK